MVEAESQGSRPYGSLSYCGFEARGVESHEGMREGGETRV